MAWDSVFSDLLVRMDNRFLFDVVFVIYPGCNSINNIKYNTSKFMHRYNIIIVNCSNLYSLVIIMSAICKGKIIIKIGIKIV